MLLAVLDIDAELCVPAQRRVDDKAAGDGLGILAQIELLVDGDGMVQRVLNEKIIEDKAKICVALFNCTSFMSFLR